MDEEQKRIENTRKLFKDAVGIIQTPTIFYKSKLDPEGKVIVEEKGSRIKLHIHPDLWNKLRSNSWIRGNE